METQEGPAAPPSGTDKIPTFEELAADPEIAPLLEFKPVMRLVKRANGWTPELQRELIARIASTGTLKEAVSQMKKGEAGVWGLRRVAEAHGFRASYAAAIALGRRRNGLDPAPPIAIELPPRKPKRARRPEDEPLPGEILNEHGKWEDEASIKRRGEEAAESIATKMLRMRRLYLQEISGSAGKRAAFEILTELPIDWRKAKRLEPQPDEPFNIANQRQPDMILTAESGWSAGEIGYGPDKKAEVRRELDRYLAKKGLPPIDWS